MEKIDENQITDSEKKQSELKKAQRDLRNLRNEYQNLFSRLPIGIYRNTPGNQGRFILANETIAKMFGYPSVNEFMQIGVADLYMFPDERESFSKRLIENLSVDSAEIQLKRKDGSSFWGTVSARAIHNENNEIDYFEGIIEDITERKRTEDQLRENEEKYRSLFDESVVGIYLHDFDGRIIDVNKIACEQVGYSRRELLNLSVFDLHPAGAISKNQSKNAILEQWKSWIYGTRFKIEAEHKRKNGTVFPVEVSTGIVSYAGKRLLLAITQDLSERKQNEKEKENLELQLRQSQKMEAIGSLAGGIAHDFNNILSPILGFTELALDEAEKDSSVKDSLQEVYSAGQRAKELVNQILVFARQSSEETKPVKPRAIAEEITHLLRSSIPTTIQINQQFESDAFIMGNATQLHQIIMNLCTNAAHAMEDAGGQLTISIKDIDGEKIPADSQIRLPHGKYVQLQVADTGTGISPEIIDSIFEPYFTTKDLGEGTGMGLAMVQGIVESYGGQIGVESSLRQGTTFTIYLPIAKSHKTSPDYQPEALPTGSERVLFVDDEAPIAQLGSIMLGRLGYDVTTRVSSTEALGLFKARPLDFDVVITDMTMPGMTGDVLAIEIMKIRAHIPVILCTGYSKRISEENAHDIGIKAFVYKPFVKADLAKTVRKVLDQNRTGES